MCARSGLPNSNIPRLQYLLYMLLVLAIYVEAPSSSAETPADNVHVLLPHTTGQNLAKIKNAFERGEIIEMKGDHQADFDSLLSISIPDLTQVTTTDTVKIDGRNLSYTATSTPKLEWEAARLAPDGIHLFQCVQSRLRVLFPKPNSGKCAAALSTWVEEEQNANAQALPAPEVADWTYLGQISLAYADDYLSWDSRVRLFRLNDIDTQSDWYMIVRDPLSTPNYQSCTPLGSCGWYTSKRDFQLSLGREKLLDPGFKLFDWSPQQEIKSGTGSLSLGFSLDSVVPKPGVGFNFSWPQAYVETTVYSAPAQKEVSWVENFRGRTSPFEPPPVTSTHAFTSHQGVIFQVPEGTADLTVNGYTYVEVTYNAFTTATHYAQSTPTFYLSAPKFGVSTPTLNLLKNSTGLVFLTSDIPYYSQRLKWILVSKPDWLDVSPTQGAGSRYLEIRDNGAAAIGNSGYVELQTDPAYGAPTVAAGPLRIKVQVVRGIASEGVLLAGGRDALGNLLTSAEVWDPKTNTTVSTYPMSTARERHTATLLLDGTILMAGGRLTDRFGLEKAELSDPHAGNFSIVSSLHSGRYDHTATLLSDGPLAGKVLIVGGCCDNAGNALSTAELYDPLTQQFTRTGSMATARMNATATLLDSGDVLVTGGAGSPSDNFGTSKAELYDPATQTFVPTGEMRQPRRNQSAVRLVNGQVLVEGGFSTPVDPLKSAEIYKERRPQKSKPFL